jgi:hypothetical protein
MVFARSPGASNWAGFQGSSDLSGLFARDDLKGSALEDIAFKDIALNDIVLNGIARMTGNAMEQTIRRDFLFITIKLNLRVMKLKDKVQKPITIVMGPDATIKHHLLRVLLVLTGITCRHNPAYPGRWRLAGSPQF